MSFRLAEPQSVAFYCILEELFIDFPTIPSNRLDAPPGETNRVVEMNTITNGENPIIRLPGRLRCNDGALANRHGHLGVTWIK
jgi:hypothetical protein